MQFTVTINQVKALEWGLNSQQALLFAFVYGCPSWTKPIKTDDGIFFALSKAKIIEELPLLTDKPDTAYRMLKALEKAGLLEIREVESEDVIQACFTDKARRWSPAFSIGMDSTPCVYVRRPVRRSSKKPIPKQLRAQVFERDSYVCLRCGCSDLHRLRADHVFPESKGGLATLENLQTLCMSCNTWKAVKTIDFRVSGGRP